MLIDCHNHLGADLFFYLNGYYPYSQDLLALVTAGKALGVDRWIVFPMVANLTFDPGAMRAGRLEPGTIEQVPYAFENERMLREIYELMPDVGRFAIPIAILDPARKPDEQVAGLRALRERFPFYGLKIQGTMIRSDVGSLLEHGRCFLDFAEEFNLPFLIHSSVGDDDPWSQASTILRVAESTPNVRFCLAHSCRFDRPSLDRVAELPNTWFDCSAHRIHCQGVTDGMGFVAKAPRRFASDYRNPKAVLRSLAETYPRKLLWGSDTPFQNYVARHDGSVISLRSTYAEEVECVASLPMQLRTEVSCDNILAWLGLPDANILSRG